MITPTTLAVSLAAILVASAGSALAGPEAAAGKADLISRELLFGNPDRATARLSPDGKMISWVAPVNGVLNVWVAPLDKLDQARVVTKDTGRGIRQYFWAFTNDHILYLQDKGGDENNKVYLVDLKTQEERDLTPFDSINGPDGKPIMLPSGKPLRPQARVEAVSENFPDKIIVGLNNRNPEFHDLYAIDLKTGALTLFFENNEWAGFEFDDRFDLRMAVRMTEDGGQEFFRNAGELTSKGDRPIAAKFENFDRIPGDDALTSGPIGFDKTGGTLYMRDSRGRDTGAMFAVDLSTGKKTLVAESAKADAGGAMIHPTEKNIQAVSFNHLRNEWTIIDPSIKPDLDYLKTVAEGEVNVTSRSLDDRTWLVSYQMDNGPTRVYVYHRQAKKAVFLFSNRKDLEGLALVKMHPIVIKSRDGLDLVSYLTLPLEADSDGDGRPEKAVPMVVNVHGGPWARDDWGFDPEAQWLANRGYAVLQVNFRGSTGFGKAFVNAGNQQWAANMHNDLLDAVDWAVDNKVAIKDKVAIYGGSYGGYAALVGLTFTPEVFACGVAIVGPSNIVTLLNTIPPYWAPIVSMFTTRVGDHRTEAGRKMLEERSPLSRVDKIQRPLLIGQGANDPRVKQSESDQIVKAMQAKNIPVTYVLFPDEGHGFARPNNRLAFYAVAEAFLAEHLGGRSQPVGTDFQGSSVQIPTGAEQVKGVKEALGNKK